MTRLPPARREALSPDQAELWETIVRSRSGDSFELVGQDGGLVGPFNAMVHQPVEGSHWEALGALLRFNSTMEQRLVELAICTVGAHFRADFEFLAHAPLAIQAGVAPGAIESLRRGEHPKLERDDERLIYDLVDQLLRAQRIPADRYEAAVALLGERGLRQLASVVGYYCWVAVTLNLFEVAPPVGQSSPWPDDDVADDCDLP